MLVDQATARLECDICGKSLDFAEVWVIGHLVEAKDTCSECFKAECRSILNMMAELDEIITEGEGRC